MIIKSLKPKYVPPMIQCEAEVDLVNYSDSYIKRRKKRCEKHGWNPHQCTHAASIDFDGKMYCHMHAGQVALADAMDEERPEWAK